MSKIKQIRNIKNLGIIENFQWHQGLNNFEKQNLIFGWNGTGKSTFSRIFRNFELKEIADKCKKYQEAQYKITFEDGTEINHSDLESYDYLRVFNKDFVEESIFRKDGKSSPIFYLGKQKIELTKEREEKKELEKEFRKQNGKLITLNSDKESLAQKSAKHIKDIFLGVKTLQHYYKNHFEDDFKNLKKEVSEGRLSIDSLKIEVTEFDEKLKEFRATEKLADTFSKLSNNLQTLSEEYLLKVETDFLNKTVSLSQNIQKLDKDFNLKKWTETGLEIHKNKNSTVCEFCEQDLPSKLIERLESYFNTEYKVLSQAVELEIARLESLKVQGKLQQIEDYNDILEGLIERLKVKQTKLTEVIYFSEKEEIKTKIETFSETLKNQQQDQETLIKKLKKSVIADNYSEFDRLVTSSASLKEANDQLAKTIDALSDKIKKEEKDIKDCQIPAQKINEDLEQFLGHTELSFVEDKDDFGDSCYQIKRHSSEEAENLSEGEKTAISVVYFLRKLKEDGVNLSDLILVVDDPISSLDSQFLFSAFSFLIEQISNAKQFFVLTHNYEFFSLLKKHYEKKAELFMFSVSLNSEQKRCSTLKPLDKLLKQFNSDYEYLFKQLKIFSESAESEKQELEKIYPYPNIARKFLEVFFSFKVPGKDLKPAMDEVAKEVGFDEREKNKIWKFINFHSHSNSRSIQTFGAGLLEPTSKDVIESVLDFVKIADLKHFENLEKII